MTEYAWPTSGCGEPCPDVPLGVDELMTLGGDVLEANTTSAAERTPEPGPEPVLERERFETHLAEVMPAERPALVREHAAERKELARRGALERRQTYVLTRLHQRHDALSKARDIFTPAPPVTGGAGIPHGAAGELSTLTAPSAENRLQQRFISLYPWTRGVACAEPQRGRWGKRWASEARVSRAVPLALDLASAPADRPLLEAVLERPVPELGFVAHPTPQLASAPSSTRPAPSVTDKPAPPTHHGCSVAQRSRSDGGVFVWLALVVTGGWARRRSPRRSWKESGSWSLAARRRLKSAVGRAGERCRGSPFRQRISASRRDRAARKWPPETPSLRRSWAEGGPCNPALCRRNAVYWGDGLGDSVPAIITAHPALSGRFSAFTRELSLKQAAEEEQAFDESVALYLRKRDMTQALMRERSTSSR